MSTDPEQGIIREQCRALISKTFVLSVSLDDHEHIPLEDCEGMNNAVGSILEQVVLVLLQRHLPAFVGGPRQRSPDYYNRGIYEYELKCFQNNPSFDLANYDAYVAQLCQDNGIRRKLFDTTYLVFQYECAGSRIQIRQFWMLQIWDLVSYHGRYPLSIQNKRGIWYNLRPSSVKGWADSGKNAHRFLYHLIGSIRLCPNPIDKTRILERLMSQMACLSIDVSRSFSVQGME